MSDRWAIAQSIVSKLLSEKYPKAEAAFVGGSFARGDATPTSDVDLILLFSAVDYAWRETLSVDGTTVEVFAHDQGTLEYFLTIFDPPTGRVPVAHVIAEGRNLMRESSFA
jgi:predicted nucleotidyltransferase